MIYHPGHFHGISHEADIHWMVNLPMATQIIIGDGKTIRWRVKHEIRKLASISWPQEQFVTINQRQKWEIDSEDSHYVVIDPPLRDGDTATMDYHYVRELD